MRQTEESIVRIKQSLAEMWILVQGQVEKAAEALLNDNKEAAHEVKSREKLVDSYELQIDRECENFFALLTPVAVDLRLVISILKINNNLERIGDFADDIATFVIRGRRSAIPDELIGKIRLREMFDEALLMLNLCKQALANEDSVTAGKVFVKDDLVDTINNRSTDLIARYVQEHPESAADCIQLSANVRRVERIGDRCSNIAEEIVFYLEAKVLKHISNTRENKH